jgi:hypothetical protein
LIKRDRERKRERQREREKEIERLLTTGMKSTTEAVLLKVRVKSSNSTLDLP